jgi:cell division protease FtsH
MVLGSVSSGASDDLKRASELAIEMVGRLGFSETFGLLSVAGIPKELLGPDVQRAVLDEARGLLAAAQATCRRVLSAQRDRLDAMARALLVNEVLSGPGLAALLGDPAPHPEPSRSGFVPGPALAPTRARDLARP